MSVKISELPILDSLADNDVIAGVDTSANVTSKIEMATLKNYIDTNTQYTAGTNIDITNNVVSAPNVYNKTETDGLIDNLKDEKDEQIEELQSEVDSLSTIFNAFPTESGEGESLTLDDTAEVKFKKFDLKGNTSQYTTTGINLFCPDAPSKTQNGITVTNNGDGTFTISGTATNNVAISLTTSSKGKKLTGSQAYTLAVDIISNGGSRGSITCEIDKNGTTQYNFFSVAPEQATGMKIQVSTPSEDATIKDIAYYVANGLVVNNLKIRLYLVKGSYTASNVPDYEPYTNGASPNPDYPQDVEIVSGDNTINICGKNFFDITQTPVVINTHYDSSGTIQVWNNYVGIREYVEVSSNTTYVQSNNLGLGITRVCFYDNAKTFLSAVTANSFTTPNNAKYIRFSIYSEGNVLPTWLQIEKGSTASTYEPYQGNTYPIYLSALGKNKFNIATIEKGYELNANNGGKQANASWWLSDYIRVEPSTEYTSSNISSNTKCWYTESKTFISKTTTQTATSPANAKYLRVNGTISSIESEPQAQIEEGSSATTFEAYNSIELCSSQDGTKRDYLLHDKTLDKWYWHREIGKLHLTSCIYRNPSYSTNTKAFCSFLLPNKDITHSSGAIDLGLCNNFGYKSGSASQFAANNNNGLWWEGSTSYSYLLITLTDASTLAKVNEWLSTNSTYIYYVLATPTNTEITYQPLIDQLNLLEKAISYEGQTNISQISNDKPFILDVTAIKSLQNVLDRIELLES